MSHPWRAGFLLHPREADRPDTLGPALERARTHGWETWTATTEEAAVAGLGATPRADLLVTVGGDGTFLLGARLAAPLGVPVLGVNRGQLGFLTDIDLGVLPEAVDAIAGGLLRLQRRSLVDLLVPGAAPGSPPDLRALALNEVAVKSHGTNLIRIRVEADEELLGAFDADGVVIATATGSTAYALSAGGPPVDPRVRAIVVVPLAPHAVITRAVVLPEAVTVHVTLEHGHGFVAADGHIDVPLREGTRLSVSPGPELQVVQLEGSPSFLQRLREKVRFGTPLKQAPDDEPAGLHGSAP